MRWTIATACLIVVVIGVALLVQARTSTSTACRPAAARSSTSASCIAWGFVAVGAFAWQRAGRRTAPAR